MKSILLHIAITIALMQPINSVKAQDALPRLSEAVSSPTPLTLKCVTDSKILPNLDFCLVAAESARAIIEDYNHQIRRFCDSLLRFDNKLRNKAKQGLLGWQDYEELKETIQTELDECDPVKGDYYAPYRARMREYRQIIEHIPKRRQSIVRGIGL
ncbi:MAG: hypothetical protein KKE30_03990 [Gammaproteobacteria bacterium]|nr:hypothetical protein [Gammaproteobacteria bacterium]